MPRYDNQRSSNYHKRSYEDRKPRGSIRFDWLVLDLDGEKKSFRDSHEKEEEKKGKHMVFDDNEMVNQTEPTAPESTPKEQIEDENVEEVPTKRIRTRSMDMADEDNLYSMSRYRICPETIGILNSKGITELFPIQALTFDAVYDGKDLIGRAPTGQGKTLAFALPIVEKIYKLGLTPPRRSRAPLVLILSPTRELAQQIDEQIRMVAPSLRSVCL